LTPPVNQFGAQNPELIQIDGRKQTTAQWRDWTAAKEQKQNRSGQAHHQEFSTNIPGCDENAQTHSLSDSGSWFMILRDDKKAPIRKSEMATVQPFSRTTSLISTDSASQIELIDNWKCASFPFIAYLEILKPATLHNRNMVFMCQV
jgi:hypothetical protein